MLLSIADMTNHTPKTSLPFASSRTTHARHFRHALALFNSARFFDAHEALEDVWRETPRHSALRRHLQGLVQVAVAFHHQSTGNRVGARSVLARALRNLQGAEASFPDLELDQLRTQLAAWQEFLAKDEPKGQAPPLPKITSSR
jgi:uncharacterized protein